jgi:hypothetical protein
VVDVRRAIALPLVLCAATAAHAQTLSSELDLTAGYSGEQIRAAASQLRLFGEVGAGIEVFAEAAWGDRWSGDAPVIGESLNGADPMGSDVFGAAYPYKGRIQLTEAFAERSFRPRGAVIGIRGGRFRLPFGIYNRSDHGYTGFVRPPLIRYDGYYGVSNNWMEDGAMVTAGLPQLFVEASLSRPHDVGFAHRRPGTDGSLRVQGYRAGVIMGVSYARSNPYMPIRFAQGRQAFTGIDARWAHESGVQARGEFLKGRSFDGVSTSGWYVDGMLHRPGMGPFTALIRGEALDYTAPSPRAKSAHRLTLGTRVRLPGPVTVQVNYLRQRGDLPHIKAHTIDVSATYSLHAKLD